MKNKNLFQAIATMVGTVIGAGILGIPYVVAEAGFWTGMSVILFLGIICILLYLYMGEAALRTKGLHQLTGYAEKYLGKKGKLMMMLAMIGSVYGALVAYIIGVGQAISAIVGGEPFLYSFLFFMIVSTIIYLGLKQVAESELLMIPLVILIVILVGIFSIKDINLGNISQFNIYNIFLPYGVILFAFLGATAIPEMEMILVKDEKMMKKAIVAGTIIPMIIYMLFAFFVVGVSGTSTTEVATIGLGEIVGRHMVYIGNVFAILTMSTSFLALGLALQQMYNLDYKISRNISWAMTCLIPLLIVISDIATFTRALEISGILAGGLMGIMIILMTLKAKKKGNRKPEYSVPINWFIAGMFILLFAGGAGYYLWSIL